MESDFTALRFTLFILEILASMLLLNVKYAFSNPFVAIAAISEVVCYGCFDFGTMQRGSLLYAIASAQVLKVMTI